MENEKWAEVPNTNGKFIASSLGNVMNTDWRGSGKTKAVKQTKHHSGYMHFKMNGKVIYTHKAIMLAFNGKCPDGKEIDHVNGDRADNRLCNLRYVSRTENVRNPVTRKRFLDENKKALAKKWENPEFREKMHKMMVDRNKNILPNDPKWKKNNSEALEKLWADPEFRKKTTDAVKKACSKPVEQYTLDGTFVKRWNSTHEIERVLGYKQPAISFCCLGKCKQRYGFVWKFSKEAV